MTKTKQKKQLLMNTNECQISNTKPETLIPANISVGCLDWIRVEKDWHKTEGINARATETNSGLAERNYNIECDTGSEPLMVVEGFWLWFCRTHRQPLCWCELAKLRAAQKKIIITEDDNILTDYAHGYCDGKRVGEKESMAQGKKELLKDWDSELSERGFHTDSFIRGQIAAKRVELEKEAQNQEAKG
jgi:hypothetical protein